MKREKCRPLVRQVTARREKPWPQKQNVSKLSRPSSNGCSSTWPPCHRTPGPSPVPVHSGVFCPTPQKGILRRLEGELLPDGNLCQGLNNRCHVNDLWCLGELVAATEI